MVFTRTERICSVLSFIFMTFATVPLTLTSSKVHGQDAVSGRDTNNVACALTVEQLKDVPETVETLQLVLSDDDNDVDLTRFKRLRRIDLGSSLSFAGFEGWSFYSPEAIEEVSFGTPLFTTSSLRTMVERLPNLKKIDLLGWRDQVAGDIAVLQSLTRLEHIRMIGVRLNQDAIRVLTEFKDLTHLDISWCEFEGALKPSELRGFKKLAVLKIAAKWDAAWCDDSFLAWLSELPKLAELDLSGQTNVGDPGIVAISKCESLRDLGLCFNRTFPPSFTATGLAAILQADNLEKLDLVGVIGVLELPSEVIDTCFEASQLTELAFAVPKNAQARQLIHPLRKLKHLRTLIIGFWEHLGPSDLDALSGVSSLESLKLLANETKGLEEVLTAVCTCGTLRKLELHIRHFSGKGVRSLTKLDQLTELRLIGSELDEAAIEAIQGLPLSLLCLHNCKLPASAKMMPVGVLLEVLELVNTPEWNWLLVDTDKQPAIHTLTLDVTAAEAADASKCFLKLSKLKEIQFVSGRLPKPDVVSDLRAGQPALKLTIH